MQSGVVDWLLEEENPPVRYLTLTNVLKKPAKNPQVRKARSRLMDYSVTKAILEHADEFWKDDNGAYWKYTGQYWQLIFLGQFLADGKDPRIAPGAEGILQKRKWVSAAGGQCLTANILAAATRLGYGDHPVVREEREALAKRYVADQGIDCSVMDYSLMSRCYMAQPKLLLCFTEVPAAKRSKAVKSAIRMLVDNLVENEVFVYLPGNKKQWQAVLERQPKRGELPKGKTIKNWVAEQRDVFVVENGLGVREPKPGWLKFGFPLHYNSDVLEAMYALALSGAPMRPKLRRPLQVIQEKRKPDGRWVMESSLNGKMWADVEAKGKPSKWLTYMGLVVLQHFAGAKAASSDSQ